MQLFIILAASAYLLYAIAAILDKHIVSNTPINPVAYAFYSSFFQLVYVVPIALAALLLPSLDAHLPALGQMIHSLAMPSADVLVLALLDAIIAVWALLALYRATVADEISRVSPIVGALVPIFTLSLSYVFMGEGLDASQSAAFAFLVLGGFLMSARIGRKSFSCLKCMPDILLTGFLWAAYYVLMDYLFTRAGFVEVFFAIQLSGVVAGSLLLLSSKNREEIRKSMKRNPGKSKQSSGGVAFVVNKWCSAVASVLIYYAISISSATLVNSMQAVQYAFVFVFALVLSRKSPQLLKEDGGRQVIWQKGVALAFTALGIGFIN